MTGAGGDSGGSGGGGQQRRRGGGRRRRHQVWVPWPDGLEGGWMNQQNCEVGGSGGGGQALEVLQLRAREAGKALPADPFSVHEAIRLALGEEGGRLVSARPESVSGTSYTLVAMAAQKELLVQKLTKIGELEVVVEEHPTRNRVRCVVTCPEVNSVPTDRLKRELADQGVTDIYRHKRQHQQQQDQQDHQQQQQQQEQYTGTMVITVRGTRQPSYIRFGMLRVPARPYQERPMQCTVCLRFGHKAATCPEKEKGPICGRCSGRHTAEEQQRGPCQRPPHCRRCGKGSRHELRSAQCPVMLREREIARVRGEITGGASFAEAQRALELAKRQQQQQQQQQKITSSTINNSSSSSSQNRSTPSYAQMAANGLGGGGNSSSSSSNNTSSSSDATNTTSNGNQPQQQQHKGHQCVGGETLARLEAVVERQATQIATLTANMQTMLQANQNLTKAVQEANSRLAHVQRQYERLLLQQQQQQQAQSQTPQQEQQQQQQDQDQTPQQDQDQLGELLQQQQQTNRPTKQKLERLGSGVTTSSKKKRKESKGDGTPLPPPPPPPPPPSPPLPLRKPWGEVMDEELQQTQIICLPDSNDEDDQNQNENDQDGYDSDRSEGAQTSEDEDDVAKNNKP